LEAPGRLSVLGGMVRWGCWLNRLWCHRRRRWRSRRGCVPRQP